MLPGKILFIRKTCGRQEAEKRICFTGNDTAIYLPTLSIQNKGDFWGLLFAFGDPQKNKRNLSLMLELLLGSGSNVLYYRTVFPE